MDIKELNEAFDKFIVEEEQAIAEEEIQKVVDAINKTLEAHRFQNMDVAVDESAFEPSVTIFTVWGDEFNKKQAELIDAEFNVFKTTDHMGLGDIWTEEDVVIPAEDERAEATIKFVGTIVPGAEINEESIQEFADAYVQQLDNFWDEVYNKDMLDESVESKGAKARVLKEEAKKYYFYALYYENFVTDEKLGVDFALEKTSDNLEELLDEVYAEVDDDVLISSTLIPELKNTKYKDMVDEYERDDEDIPTYDKLLKHGFLDYAAYLKSVGIEEAVANLSDEEIKAKLEKAVEESKKDAVNPNWFDGFVIKVENGIVSLEKDGIACTRKFSYDDGAKDYYGRDWNLGALGNLVIAWERENPKNESITIADLNKAMDKFVEVKEEIKQEFKKALKEEHYYTKDEEENNRFVKLYKKCYEYKKEHPEMEAYEIANKLCFNPNEDWVQLDEVAKTWADMFVFDGAKDEELIKTVREDIVEMIEEYLIDDEENGDFEEE